MKGRDITHMGVGTIAGILLGAGITAAVVYPSAREQGYQDGAAHESALRENYGREQHEKGRASGLEEGLAKGREEGYTAAGTWDVSGLPRYDGDDLVYGSIDIAINGGKYSDFINSRTTPSDVRIICDLRGFSQPEMERNGYALFNKRNLLNLVWHNGLPEGSVRVYTTQRTKDKWDQERTEERRIMQKFIPPETKYPIVIVPEGSLATVDYARQFLNERKPLEGYEFTPERVRLSDKLPVSDNK